jgi:hypothetical protein
MAKNNTMIQVAQAVVAIPVSTEILIRELIFRSDKENKNELFLNEYNYNN